MQEGDQWPCADANSWSDLNYNYDSKLKDWLLRLNHVSRLISGYMSGWKVTPWRD